MLGAAVLVLASVTSYSSLFRRETLIYRLDNPRLVLREQSVQRGAILDRNGVQMVGSTLEDGQVLRDYLIPEAAPVIGYASLNYGLSGIEAASDSILRGAQGHSPFELWWKHDVLHEPRVGRAVQLTLDSNLQLTAAKALAGYRGAVVVIEPSSGTILALASAPTFDPNSLDEQWDALIADERAPLLNRATLGQYAPGQALLPMELANALEENLIAESNLPAYLSTLDAFLHPVRNVAGTSLTAGLFLPAIDFPLPIPDAASLADDKALKITPLQMAVAVSTLANSGTKIFPFLVLATEDIDNEMVSVTEVRNREQVFEALSVQVVSDWLESLQVNDPNNIVEISVTAEQIESNQLLGWYWGYEEGELAIVVVLEDATGELAVEAAEAIWSSWHEMK